MAQLIVRNLDKQLKLKLKMQAKQKGISMEEEVRQIIRQALSETSSGFGSDIVKRFKHLKSDLQDFEFPELKGQTIKAPDLEI